MKIELSGTRGSLAAAGPGTVGYGGDTASILVTAEGRSIVLDAGSGIRRLGEAMVGQERVDVLLTHLHMDHIQGLGFFGPMFDPTIEVHVWGPGSPNFTLEQLLSRYLSPPLFPVHVRELSSVVLHDTDPGSFELGPVTVTTDYVCHPGATLGYRLSVNGTSMAYLPDHEPALGVEHFPEQPEWTSGYDLMAGVDVLIHDAQYTDDEYAERQGWGHSTFDQALDVAELCEVGSLVTFHHDPGHDDRMLDDIADAIATHPLPFEFIPGRAGTVIDF